MRLFVRTLGNTNRSSLRGVGLAGALVCVAMGIGAQAQQSAGPSSYHLTAVNSGDLTGGAITGISSVQGVPRTDGKIVAYLTGSTNGACGTQLMTLPIGGGTPSTLMSPSMKVEPQQSGGGASICDLTFGGSNVYYSAFYTPPAGIERIGIFKVPLIGGASSEVIANNDPVAPFVPGVSATTTPTVGFVETSQFSIDPPTGGLLDYYQATEWSGNTSYVSNFNTYLLYGSPEQIPATSSCPGVTVQGNTSYFAVSTDGTIYATTILGTGTNYAGVTKSMTFLMIGPWPFAGGCAGVAFSPDLGSMAGGGTFILPGEPAGVTTTPAQIAVLSNPEVSNGVVYVTAYQGSYGGIFVAANNFGSNPNGSRGTFPLTNGQWPANLNPIPTKLISNYDPIPGITLGLPACHGTALQQTPTIQSQFTAAGSFVVFEETQTVQNCTTMATTQAGGIYAYNLTTNTVQPVALYGSTLAAGDSPITALGSIVPGSLSADGHLVFTAGTTPAGSTAQTSVLYTAYLNQVVSTVSVAAPATVVTGNQFTIIATVNNNKAAPNGVAATGTVQFFDGTIPLGPQVALSSSGTATYTKSTSSAGPRNFHAVYSGDALYEGATSAASPVMVLNPSPTVALNTSSTLAAAGQGIVLTAQLSSGASGYPTGQVVFTGGSVTLGTSAVGSTGAATLTVSTLPVGITTVFATYTGDANFSGATSPNVAITVGAPDYTITVAPPSATITAGQTTTFVFTVTPVFGFSLPVTFSCGALPAEVTCTFAPPTVTPGGGPVSSTLTIATTAPRVASNEAPRGLFPRGGGVAGVCLAMLFAWLPRRVRQRRGWTVFVLLGMLSVGMLSISGCSGGNSAGGGTNDPGTTKGSATVTVSASAGSGSGAVSHSAGVTLVIQ